MTRPTLVVELGYLSGWEIGTSLLGTSTYLATVSYSQDISDLVRSVSIRRGRQHELNRMEAGTAQVVVLNQDGAMTLIPPMTSIRIRATLPDPPFAPDDIVGMVAWYDLSLVSTLWQDTARTSQVTADGQTVKGVTDLSGLGHHLSEATNGPTYKTAIFGSLSVARFDGTDDILTATMAADASFTAMIVAQKRSAPGAGNDAVFGVGNFRAQIFASSGFHATSYVWYQNEALGATTLNATAANLNALVLKVNSAASVDFYANGGSPTNFDPQVTITTGTTFTYGANPDPDNWGDYDIGEVCIYDTALAAADMNLLGAYLATKWGFTWTTVV